MTMRGWFACVDCVHLLEEDVDATVDFDAVSTRTPRKCKAFPEQIPDAIWFGENDHTQPFAGDNGIQYEQVASDDLTAAADIVNGAMIALIPVGEQLADLVVPNGESEDELHLTLFYLGSVTDIDQMTRDDVIEVATTIADVQPVITARAFGASVFNPAGDEPCLVLVVSGAGLDELRESIEVDLAGFGIEVPEQHEPWIPHITLMYVDEPWRFIDLAAERTGDVTFDRIRVAFGGEVTDIPLQETIVAHLGGKHNQKSHGHGGGGSLATVDDSKIKKSRASFDERVGKAKTEGDVYGAVPLGMGKPGAPSENAEVVGALDNYAGGTGYYDVNQGLRNAHGHADQVTRPSARSGSAPSKIKSDEELRSTIDTMDRGMDASHLTDDVVLHRVVADPERLFGSAYHRDGDNSGLTWSDHGFTSTTLSTHGVAFQQGRLRGGTEAPEPGGQLVMKILAPKGTHALIGRNDEGEIILDRGLKFRVVRDHGIDDRTRRDMELGITKSYTRQIDVEIFDE